MKKNKNWSVEDLEILERMYKEQRTGEEIALALGRTKHAVYQKIKRLQNENNGKWYSHGQLDRQKIYEIDGNNIGRYWDKHEIEALNLMRDKYDMTCVDIAFVLKRTPGSVSTMISRCKGASVNEENKNK